MSAAVLNGVCSLKQLDEAIVTEFDRKERAETDSMAPA